MAIIGLVGGLAIVTVTVLWATVKILRYALESGNSNVVGYVERVWTVYLIFTVAAVVVELWPGLASWTTAVYHTLIGLL